MILLFLTRSPFARRPQGGRYVILKLRTAQQAAHSDKTCSSYFVASGEPHVIAEVPMPPERFGVAGRWTASRCDLSPFEEDNLVGLVVPSLVSSLIVELPKATKGSKLNAKSTRAPETLSGRKSVNFVADFVVFAVRESILVSPSADQLHVLQTHASKLL